MHKLKRRVNTTTHSLQDYMLIGMSMCVRVHERVCSE